MAELRCLHTADLHLGARFPALGERDIQRRADFLKTFERLITLAIKNEVQLFLVAGDLFDSPHPDETVVAKVQTELQRLSSRGIVPVLLPGTHDSIAVRDSVYLRHTFPGILLAEPRVEAPVSVTVAGIKVHLYGFAYRSGTTSELLASMRRRELDGFHLGLLHGARIGSPEWGYRHKDLPFNLEDLQALELDYIALGHYHNFEVLRSAQGRVIACYPGAPEGKRFGENGPRYSSLVTIGAGGVEVQPLVTYSRRLEDETLDLTGISSIDAAESAVTGLADPDLLLRLRLTGTIEFPLRITDLELRCRDRFFTLELLDQTRFYDSDYVRRIEAEETVRGLFVRRTRRLLEETAPEQRAVVADAFREVLARFSSSDRRGK